MKVGNRRYYKRIVEMFGVASDPAHYPRISQRPPIKPKAKLSRKAQLSRVKKTEIEKQTLLVMDQMISHVADFTTKERYFDYKKIANNIKAYKLTSNECKKLWE